jgi:large subunit ribosomal protein L9
MELVLRQDVENVGLRGEVVNVARGYARNYLLPRGLAEVATPALQREVVKRDAQRARHEAKTVDEARAIAERLEAKELRFDVSAGPTGSLFGSVTATNVADRLWAEQKIRVDRRKLHLDTIKRVVVAPEGQELPSEEELAAVAAAEAAASAEAAEAASEAHTEAEAAVAEAEAATDAPVVSDADETPAAKPARPLDEPGEPVETET